MVLSEISENIVLALPVGSLCVASTSGHISSPQISLSTTLRVHFPTKMFISFAFEINLKWALWGKEILCKKKNALWVLIAYRFVVEAIVRIYAALLCHEEVFQCHFSFGINSVLTRADVAVTVCRGKKNKTTVHLFRSKIIVSTIVACLPLDCRSPVRSQLQGGIKPVLRVKYSRRLNKL